VQSNITEALYLEGDAAPVPRFQEKFADVLGQLHTNAPDYDVAYIGTCLGNHITKDAESEQKKFKKLSRNIFLHHASACFNAVLISRKGVNKVFQFETPKTNFTNIDLIFSHFFEQSNFTVVQVRQPLMFEESKAYSHHYCEEE